MSQPLEEPYLIPDDPPGSLLGTSRTRVERQKKGEFLPLWIMLGLAGLGGIGYATYLGLQPAEIVKAPAPIVVTVDPSPADEVSPSFENPPSIRKRASSKSNRVPAATPKEPIVEVVTETPEMRKNDAPVDPTKSFESGDSFDRPNGPDSRGRSGSNTFESPPHGRIAGDSTSSFENPPQGPGASRGPNSNRPNRPDPSFDDPAGPTPATKKGRRR
jgi:hypothetical protein